MLGQDTEMTMSRTSDFSELGMPLRLARPVRLQGGTAAESAVVNPEIVSRTLDEAFNDLSGGAGRNVALTTRLFELPLKQGDEVLVRDRGSNRPMVVRRDDELIVAFDVECTQPVYVEDSKRPIYTYIPGFNIHTVPERVRRPISNAVQLLFAPINADIESASRTLPLTGFDFTVLLVSTALDGGHPYRWPEGKRAAFIALHDVDTSGFLQRRERDALFRVESKHGIRSTWFVPTTILNLSGNAGGIQFLLDSGHEIGWHGHKHDHRDHVKPFAEAGVQALASSVLFNRADGATGMRLPKLLKSNHLFELLEDSCPGLRYDTSFLRGIVPYRLWLRGRPSRILEIPTTVPTDINVHNQLHDLRSGRRADRILNAQITRTEALIRAGALISIVTHPEEELSERPDLLGVYDQYLSYIRSRSDIWFTTAGELLKYWTTTAPAIASSN
jgi:peptidoglycan/xylan/chitin deacetylase (PgdA/CDA1 family)